MSIVAWGTGFTRVSENGGYTPTATLTSKALTLTTHYIHGTETHKNGI